MNYMGYEVIACITYWWHVYLDELDNLFVWLFICQLWLELRKN